MAEESSSSDDSGWGNWLQAGMVVAGGAMANASSARQVRLQHAAQWGFQDDQQQFADYMSSTAHRREVNDLRLAGLNPMLSINKGAATPMGGGAPGASAKMENIMAAGPATAMAARRVAAEVDNIKADTTSKDRLEALYRYQGQRELEQKDLIHQQRLTEVERTRTEGEEARIRRNQRYGWDIEGTIDREGLGDVTRRLERGGSSAGSIMRGISPRSIRK